MEKDKILTHISQSVSDTLIDDYIWNSYFYSLYSSKYRLGYTEEGISCILCKYGFIIPYSLKKGLYYFVSALDSPSLRKQYLIRTLPSYCASSGSDSDGALVIFPKVHLPDLEKVLKIRKKKVLSAETKERLRLHMSKIRPKP